MKKCKWATSNMQETLAIFLFFINFFYSLSQCVKFIISLGILMTFALQFYIPVVILWPKVANNYGPFKHPITSELIFRTLLVFVTCKYATKIEKIDKLNCLFVVSVTLAEVIPYLGLFISLVGAVSSTALALIFPPLLELAIKWSISDMTPWMIVKNVAICLIGLLGCVTGTYESIVAIIHAFEKENLGM